MPLFLILVFAVLLGQPCPERSRADELDRQHPLPAPPTDLGQLILPEDGERLGIPYTSLREGEDEEYWLRYGPYPWGVHEYEGSVKILGESYDHLLQVWYPGKREGEDVPAATMGAPFPVVFFQHAGGSYYTWYDYQFSRLATHGIIVVSMYHSQIPHGVDVWESHSQLFSETIDLIFDVWNTSPDHFLYQSCDSVRIGLAGHSHGAAFVAMREYRPMNPDGEYEISCVSLIAPCPDYYSDLEAFATVYAGMPPLQVIYGSKDKDGCCAHGQSTAIYEVGRRPKHFSYVIGASHHVFDEGGDIAEATITREEAFRASGASLAAYHAWMLNGDASALPYLRGDRPLLTDGPEVRYQFLGTEHVVVDNFEDEGTTDVAEAVTYASFAEPGGGDHDPSQNSLGLPVIDVELETFDELDMLEPSRTLFHPTWGLEYAWENPRSQIIETLADETGPVGFDASGWRVLSFRILQVHGDPLNPEGRDQNLTVRLEDLDGQQAELDLADAPQGRLRYAMPPASSVGWKSILETYRLPLIWFIIQNPNLDLTRLRNVSFLCNRSATGRLIIDDIELASKFHGPGPDLHPDQ